MELSARRRRSVKLTRNARFAEVKVMRARCVVGSFGRKTRNSYKALDLGDAGRKSLGLLGSASRVGGSFPSK